MIENPNVICNDCGFCKQNKELEDKCERLEKQLEIAIKALETAHTYPSSISLKEWCEQKIKQIKELEK